MAENLAPQEVANEPKYIPFGEFYGLVQQQMRVDEVNARENVRESYRDKDTDGQLIARLGKPKEIKAGFVNADKIWDEPPARVETPAEPPVEEVAAATRVSPFRPDEVLDEMDRDPVVDEIPPFAVRTAERHAQAPQEEISEDQVEDITSQDDTLPTGDKASFKPVGDDTAEFPPVPTGSADGEHERLEELGTFDPAIVADQPVPDSTLRIEKPEEITPAAVEGEGDGRVIVEPPPEGEEELAAGTAAMKPPAGSGLQEWEQAFPTGLALPEPEGVGVRALPEPQIIPMKGRVLSEDAELNVVLPPNGEGRHFTATPPAAAATELDPQIETGEPGELLTSTEEDEAANQADVLTPHPDAGVTPKGDQEEIVQDVEQAPAPAAASVAKPIGRTRERPDPTVNRVLLKPGEVTPAADIIRKEPAVPLPIIRQAESPPASDGQEQPTKKTGGLLSWFQRNIQGKK